MSGHPPRGIDCPERFYVPHSRSGSRAPGCRGRAPRRPQVTYKDNIKEIDSFEMTVNNWDAETRTFKYVGAETAADLEGGTNDSSR